VAEERGTPVKACRRIAILRGSVVPRRTQVYPPLKAVSRVTDKKLELLYPILILRIASAAFYLFTAQLLYPILRKAEAPCLF
jgi:hypothetical protein